MKNNILWLALLLASSISLKVQGQYYGSQSWTNDIMASTNMSMFVNNSYLMNQQILKPYIGKEGSSATKQKEKSKALTTIKIFTFKPSGNRLLPSIIHSQFGDHPTVEQTDALKYYSTILDTCMKLYEKEVKAKKQNPYNIGLAAAFFVELTYALKTGKLLDDEQLIDMSQEFNQVLGKDDKFNKTTNEQKQLLYEIYIGPQFFNLLTYQQAIAEKDTKTAEKIKKEGMKYYKTIVGKDFPNFN